MGNHCIDCSLCGSCLRCSSGGDCGWNSCPGWIIGYWGESKKDLINIATNHPVQKYKDLAQAEIDKYEKKELEKTGVSV